MKTKFYFLIFIFVSIPLACNSTQPPQIFATNEPPGVGEKAEQGYAFSEPIIAALEEYKINHGTYPQTLAELVPDYLSSVPTSNDILDFSYSSTGDSYSFSFHYRGPGLNTCTYTPEDKEWDCSGAF